MKVINIKKEFRTTALVESESTPGAFYKVTYENGRMTCTCPNHTKAGKECKHIIAFKAELEQQRAERENE